MFNSLASEDDQFSIEAQNSVTGQTRHFDLANLPNKKSETGNLHNVLKIAVGARVMLTVNVNVTDGLDNGASGEVIHIVTVVSRKVKTILVKFDDENVGREAIRASQHRDRFSNAVPISRAEVKFNACGKRGSEVTRSQFPLTLAWATTIHKVQGLTLNEIVVDMEGSSRFSPGQAYVTFSRVKTLAGLHIIKFNAGAIKKNEKVDEEMVRLNDNLLNAPVSPEIINFFDNSVTFLC